MTPLTIDHLLQENEDLRHRLEEAEDALRALRAGEVDAVLVDAGREQVYTLETADKAYRLLVEQVPHGAATLTADGAIIYCNRRFAELLRRPLHSLFGKPIGGFVAPHSLPLLEALLRDGQGEVPLRRADGTTVPVYLGVTTLQEGALGSCLMVTDLTEQRHYQELKRTQAALRESEQKFDTALASIRDYVYIFDRDGRFVYANKILLDLWNLTPDQAVGKTMADLDYPKQLESELLGNVRQVFASGQPVTSVTHYTSPTGVGGSFENVLAPVADAESGVSLVVGVSRDITERLRVEVALKDADRRKDVFLATLAHELRNPLAPIRNALQILMAKGPLDPELQWAQGVIDRQVQQMARLLEDLLDVSRISQNRLKLRKEWVELAAVLGAALETSRPVIEAGGHELTVTLPPEPIHLEGDPVRLAQVFANLLNNAAKYTEEGGRIRLAAERQGSEVAVSVKDTGIGITSKILPRVFEVFTQSKRALMRSQGGLGIGLSLVKGLVELHGGSIEARSDGAGRGSEFVVRLPVVGEKLVQEPAQAGEDEQPKPVMKCRVLVADDSRDSADSLAMFLKIKGYEVGTAYDGEQAVEAAEALRPDVVLLDIGMPNLDGYDACRRIRQQPWGQGMFLIALTGWGQEEDRRRTEEAGFNQHVVKPVDPAALMKLLASLSAKQGGQLIG
ncbi:MAG: Autoinducer 2 sensor kinase/phosphatase LuxQ [Chromatiales bacterium USCg_Taylor]|nr:MAG: Autoinducer 2 sensor kinase/phosphatase LuxQ [Chromatiales bacterium USCg_Taylor]